MKLEIPLLIGAFSFRHRFAHLGWLSFPVSVLVESLIMTAVLGVVLNLLILWRIMKPVEQRRCTTKLNAETFADIYHNKTKTLLRTAISKVRYHQGDIHCFQKGKDGKYVPRSAFSNRQHSLAFYEEAIRLWKAAKEVHFFARSQDETAWPPPPRIGG